MVDRWLEMATKQATQLLKKTKANHVALFAGDEQQKLQEILQKQNIITNVDAKCAFLYGMDQEMQLASCKAEKVLVVAYNQAHLDIAISTLIGEKVQWPENGTTLKQLTQRMQAAGYHLMAGNDVKGRLPGAEERISAHGETLLKQFVESVKSNIDDTGDSVVLVRLFARDHVPQKENEGEHPFLTVLTRTQGNRLQELGEVAICLAAQSCRDFEWLVVGHKVPQDRQAGLMRFLDEIPAYLKNRTRYIAVEDGTRTRPLNEGFEQSNGDYVAILDDDDLVTDRWVEEFQDAARKKPGSFLHAYAVGQKWERLKDNTIHRAVEAPQPMFCKPFQWQRQYWVNDCPPVALAFPRYAFDQLGIRFDESLNVTEDWDMIMRTVGVTGVCDIPRVTSIYRLWNTGASHDVHQQAEWDETFNKIVAKYDASPVLFPAHAGLVPLNHDDAVNHVHLFSVRNVTPSSTAVCEENAAQNDQQTLKEQVAAIQKSRSYKVMFPVRWFANFLRVCIGKPLHILNWGTGGLMRRTYRFAEQVCPQTINPEKADSETLARYAQMYTLSHANRIMNRLRRYRHGGA